MAYENTGILSFANALGNAGQLFGNALASNIAGQKRQKYLAELGDIAGTDNYVGMAKAAFANGDLDTAMQALAKAEEVKRRKLQEAADAEALGIARGPTGGVTVNPNPQPMNLPGASLNLSNAIIGQESGGNPNIGRSVNGAVGIGQITPDTFKRFAQPGEDINRPEDNLAVSRRMIDTFMQKYGDPARAAVAYFSGEGNVAPKGSPTPWIRDVADGNKKTTSSYVSDVMRRMGRGVQVADASGAIPQSAQPQQLPQPEGPSIDAVTARIANISKALEVAKGNETRQRLGEMLDAAKEQYRVLKDQNTPKLQQFGDTVYDTTGGKLRPVQKIEKPASEKAPTEAQAKAATYYTENKESNDILNSPEALAGGTGYAGAFGRSVASIPGVGASLTPEETGKFKQAADTFVQNVVYAKSGANAPQAEFERAYNQYIPTPFDSPNLIKQKAEARQTWLDQQKVSAASAYKGDAAASPAVDHLARARKALADGIPREDVIKTLRSLNVDPAGL